MLAVEKLPLLAIAAVVGFVTFVAQRRAGAVSGAGYTLADRLANVPVAYARYLARMVWFSRLAVFYPLEGWPAGVVATCTVALLAVTAAAFQQRFRRPWLAVGWLWFVVALLPVIGVVQAGAQAMADRFAYLASLGLAVAIVWSVPWPTRTAARKAVVLGGAFVLAALAFFTVRQIGYWRDPFTLFNHALAVTDDNWVAHSHLADELADLGRRREAIDHYREAVRLAPQQAPIHTNYGAALAAEGRTDEAIQQYRAALSLDPNHATALVDLGVSLLKKGDAGEAEEQFLRAVSVARNWRRRRSVSRTGSRSGAIGPRRRNTTGRRSRTPHGSQRRTINSGIRSGCSGGRTRRLPSFNGRWRYPRVTPPPRKISATRRPAKVPKRRPDPAPAHPPRGVAPTVIPASTSFFCHRRHSSASAADRSPWTCRFPSHAAASGVHQSFRAPPFAQPITLSRPASWWNSVGPAWWMSQTYAPTFCDATRLPSGSTPAETIRFPSNVMSWPAEIAMP